MRDIVAHDLALNVLDQSPIRAGGTPAQALHETVELAVAAERFGYKRYWVAEHHSSEGFAGTAPEVLIGQIAAKTSTIHVGSGGVMLSHYSALKVAETFRVLAAFYPGRIDLGLGRAPGSDQKTAVALAYPKPVADINEFPQQVADVVGFLHDALTDEHPFAGILAQPGLPDSDAPQVWLLGSSDYSARLAALLGLPFAFADFFGNAGDIGPRVAELYRRQFEPSDYLATPKVGAAVHVVCADTDERAAFIASSTKAAVAQMRMGLRRTGLLPPEEASRLIVDDPVRQVIAAFTRHFVQGDPASVRRQLLDVADRYGADELTIATNCYAFADRLRSYELVATAFAHPA